MVVLYGNLHTCAAYRQSHAHDRNGTGTITESVTNFNSNSYPERVSISFAITEPYHGAFVITEPITEPITKPITKPNTATRRS